MKNDLRTVLRCSLLKISFLEMFDVPYWIFSFPFCKYRLELKISCFSVLFWFSATESKVILHNNGAFVSFLPLPEDGITWNSALQPESLFHFLLCVWGGECVCGGGGEWGGGGVCGGGGGGGGGSHSWIYSLWMLDWRYMHVWIQRPYFPV